jgi:hypothetical protein
MLFAAAIPMGLFLDMMNCFLLKLLNLLRENYMLTLMATLTALELIKMKKIT